MSGAQRMQKSAGASFLGAVVEFYVPTPEVDAFRDRTAAASIEVRFDAPSGIWRSQANMVDFEDERVKGLLASYGKGSEGEVKRRAELAAEVKGSESAARSAEAGAVTPVVGPAGRAAPVSEVEAARYLAVSIAAREDGRNFEAKYIRFGFSLAGVKNADRRKVQMGELEKASDEEIRSVAYRNSERYTALLKEEDRARFEYAVAHDPGWKGRLESEREKVGASEGDYVVFGQFMALDNDKKRQLATKPNGEVVGLAAADKGLMVSLSEGWRQMEVAYLGRTGKPFGRGLVGAAALERLSVGAVARNLASGAERERMAARAAASVADQEL